MANLNVLWDLRCTSHGRHKEPIPSLYFLYLFPLTNSEQKYKLRGCKNHSLKFNLVEV